MEKQNWHSSKICNPPISSKRIQVQAPVSFLCGAKSSGGVSHSNTTTVEKDYKVCSTFFFKPHSRNNLVDDLVKWNCLGVLSREISSWRWSSSLNLSVRALLRDYLNEDDLPCSCFHIDVPVPFQLTLRRRPVDFFNSPSGFLGFLFEDGRVYAGENIPFL